MKKTLLWTMGLIFFGGLFYFTLESALGVFRSESQGPTAPASETNRYRLVLITQDLETPFWDKVGKGALDAAKKDGASLEVWGSYGKNQEEFLKKIEIAIDSKVDGIIVQGLESDDFKSLAKIKAAFNGIPIITVANDVSAAESLRKTYVGSDQYEAGKLIANRLVADMGTKGDLILLGSDRQDYSQQQRKQGILDVLARYPDIRIDYAATPYSREKVVEITQRMMNERPNVDAFIAIEASNAGAMIQEIGKRSRVEPYYIYSFDDSSETYNLMKQGKIDGLIEQSPEAMGRTSVDLMTKWLDGELSPLNAKGYFTEIRMLKAEDAR